MTRTIAAAGACVALAVSAPAFAQGKSQDHKKGAPPSRNELAAPAIIAAPAGATPLAWIDDATLVAPGFVSLSVSALRWSGADATEVDAPVVDAAFGLAPRVQLSASVPRVVGSADPAGAAGGMGTSFFTAKVALWDRPRSAFKLAAAPTMQLLGQAVATSLGADQGRVRWGLPLSGEVDGGPLRVYGGGGYFSPGLWFGGGAVAARTSERMVVTAGVSRAWRTAADQPGVPLSERDRKEISGGAAYTLNPSVTVFASLGHTVATLDQNGAGMSVSGGLSVFFATESRRP